MANSKVEIANMALIGLRASPINSFEDEKTEARAVNVLWNTVRRSELSKHPWNFAIKRAQLARLSAAPLFGYRYQYQLPADHLRTISIQENVDFREENHRVLTNTEEVLIKYVYDNTDTATWTASFDDLVAARLRLELAYTVSADKNMLELSQQLYTQKSREAKWIDANGDPGDSFGQQTPTLIKVRY
jgi:hypothetical protein